MLTNNQIISELFEKGEACKKPFLWFCKDAATGELLIWDSQQTYNEYVRKLNSDGLSYKEELDLGNTSDKAVYAITAVVFQTSSESAVQRDFSNEFADFFNIEYRKGTEYILLKVHYNHNIQPAEMS